MKMKMKIESIKIMIYVENINENGIYCSYLFFFLLTQKLSRYTNDGIAKWKSGDGIAERVFGWLGFMAYQI